MVNDAQLQVCEIQQDGWAQSYPADGACYDLTIDPAGITFAGDLDFGNTLPAWLP